MHLNVAGNEQPGIELPRVPMLILRDESGNDVGTIVRFQSGWCIVSKAIRLDGQPYLGMELIHANRLMRQYGIERSSSIYTWLNMDPIDESFEYYGADCQILHSGVAVLGLYARAERIRGRVQVPLYIIPTVQLADCARVHIAGGPIEVTRKTALERIGAPEDMLDSLTAHAMQRR